MKQNIIAIAAITAAISAQAQQLPNNGFEDDWVTCTPWTSNNTHDVGTTPKDWCIANVAGYKFFVWIGATTVGTKVAGYNSNNAVKLTCGMAADHDVPGYMTLGTSWNTSVMGNENDGGSFGGKAFTNRPDALSFMYQHGNASGSDQPYTVVAYTWKGSTSQADVPGCITASGTPKTATLTNRDRNILGITPIKGGAITKSNDFALIASINQSFTDAASSWTNRVVDFTYADQNGTAPTMINVIFAACNYWTQDQKENDWLTIDDVKLLYYSKLSSIKVNGTTIEGFDENKYSYDVTVPYYSSVADAQASLTYTVKGQEATATKTDNGNTTTITVKNAAGTDASGEKEHTYTVNFTMQAVPEGLHMYRGLLDIVMGEPLMTGGAKYILITDPKADGTVDFTLPNFSLNTMEFGDIAVPNMTVTRNESEGRTYYQGHVESLQLMNGAIEAKVDVKGYIADNGDICLNIPVKWLMNGQEIPIDVRFYSRAVLTSATLSLKQGWGYGTFCAPFETVMPSGVTAYQVNGIKANGCVDMEALESVPANTPVIIAGSEGVEQDYYGEAVEGTPQTQYMTGTYQTVQATADTYVLQNKGGVVAFYHVASGKEPIIGANRCWLNATASGVKALYFDTTTGLDAIRRSAPTEVYDLTGRRLTRAAKGVNIVNGKKIIVK